MDPEAFVEAVWHDSEVETFRRSLLDWYETHRRELPWRGDVSPYEHWVAEVMLQQTQVSTVVDYYRRWLDRFPTVEALAEADREQVMELWEGLGYYRRARYLHESARRVVEERDGELPMTADGLEQLKGIGEYTAGAIASIAFNESVPVVDGNVARVLARLRQVTGDPTSTDFRNVSWAMAGRLVDPDRPGDFNQAMMELGATVCTPTKPTCMLCPVSDKCDAFASGDVESFPEPVDRGPRKQMRVATAVVLAAEEGGQAVLVRRRPAEGLFGGLWEFPSQEVDEEGRPDADRDDELGRIFESAISGETSPSDGSIQSVESVGDLQHTLTHIEMTIDVYVVRLESKAVDLAKHADEERRWIEVASLSDVAMSTAMRKVERRALSGDGGSTSV